MCASCAWSSARGWRKSDGGAPAHAFAFERIAACWPDARFVFLLRHPASIAISWHEASPDKRTPAEAAADALRYMKATERARKAPPGVTVRMRT
ncbi:hypothetical protein HD597_003875 [Nonomuraea thailandensis]|uniref:Sulfotransferase n=1 Tax=Nonomuraea thailandensis TaxID=1188745 RepID=A0A9X2GFS6_9ACTN|nr:sulfotransferase [Nonomuraea thailandensis]MCP2356855.1 hypothetical protein [Nonomuraea thailandensis]